MIQIKISGHALQDPRDGYVFYEAQESGLGDYCRTCLRADIEALRVYGGIHRMAYRDCRRLLSRVFPCAVFDMMDGNCPIGWAMIDLRRDPEWRRRKLIT